MARERVGGVARLIQNLWDSGISASLEDDELLRRFLLRGATAEEAFATLVNRHAPMVLRVCRDVTGDPHDAEVAAQVTFLVLARKACSIRRGDSLASWLFGTARRVASRSMRESARRRGRHRRYAETSAASATTDDRPENGVREWSGLYEELDRLPERYRLPIILCDLEGQRHEQAAASIGCPLRTLQTRLYRGRDRLRERLVRRGLAPSFGFGSGPLTVETGRAAVPAAWSEATAEIGRAHV